MWRDSTECKGLVSLFINTLKHNRKRTRQATVSILTQINNWFNEIDICALSYQLKAAMASRM
ncbi:hypothetical protein BDQ12DRAFT_691761 [Crucibulum laeve]|uniref:Uncharacterized protein n=1 Tax=Crucibulum laeve TaxID=68775 RepID=A0A5C3LK20_9AGAR|nr:hypothetical protein BDQ12DRAFT_691761 [Crucibulum laeve]